MAEKLLRKGQSVYAADGTYLGRLLHYDPRFMVSAPRAQVAPETVGPIPGSDRVSR
jgi:hypothetical protein